MHDLTVKLISHTAYPVETLYAEWIQSRTEDYVHTAAEYARLAMDDDNLYRDIHDTVEKIVCMRLPVLETIYFVFLLENIPISLREQLVRHRVGHRFGQRLGCDIIPDIDDSSFWSQSMRVKNMAGFSNAGGYHIPQSVFDNPMVLRAYRAAMTHADLAYSRMVRAGTPPEDARNVIPLGVTHRMTWCANFAALANVLSKRTCWIAQLGLWEPLIRGVLDALRECEPMFDTVGLPPCFDSSGKFKECVYCMENCARSNCDDPGVPCSLWVNQHDGCVTSLHARDTIADTEYNDRQARYENGQAQFAQLWQHDPETGEPL